MLVAFLPPNPTSPTAMNASCRYFEVNFTVSAVEFPTELNSMQARIKSRQSDLQLVVMMAMAKLYLVQKMERHASDFQNRGSLYEIFRSKQRHLLLRKNLIFI